MYWNPTSKPYHFRFFKGCLLQILLGPFLNTLTHIVLSLRRFAARLIWIKNLLINWRKDSGNQPCRKVMSLFLLSGCSTDSWFSCKLNRMPKNLNSFGRWCLYDCCTKSKGLGVENFTILYQYLSGLWINSETDLY